MVAMEFLAVVLVGAAVVGILARLAAFLLGAGAWFLLVTVALGLLVGVPVPGAITAFTVVLWFGSQVASRLRLGGWRSMGLRGLSRAVDAVRASV
jgi:hypothetical protein